MKNHENANSSMSLICMLVAWAILIWVATANAADGSRQTDYQRIEPRPSGPSISKPADMVNQGTLPFPELSIANVAFFYESFRVDLTLANDGKRTSGPMILRAEGTLPTNPGRVYRYEFPVQVLPHGNTVFTVSCLDFVQQSYIDSGFETSVRNWVFTIDAANTETERNERDNSYTWILPL